MENMGSQRRNNITKKSSKPIRRRSQTRRALQHCIINMAEARREIVQALRLHRSSGSSKTRTSTSAAEAAVSMFGDSKVGNSAQSCYYSLTESMPVPEPIWSTTAPAIPAAVTPAGALESLEFEWGESQAAAYSWWLGFLKTLDGKNMNNHNNNNVENSKCQQHLEKFVMGNSGMFGYQESSKLGEEQDSYPDEWLIIPTTDDETEHQTTTNST